MIGTEVVTEHDLTAAAEQVEQLVHTDPAAAEPLILRTLAAAEAAGRPAIRARVTYARARLLAERGRLDEALELIAEARALWESSGEEGDDVAAVRTGLGTMQILDDLGRHRDALEVGHRLLASLDDLAGHEPTVRVVRAAALGNIGVALSFLGQHDESLHSYELSERLYGELEMPLHVAQQRANRGIELLALGRARESRALLMSSEAQFRAEGDPLWAAKCAAHLAEAHQQLGDLVEALLALDRSRTELLALGAAAEEARVHLQLSRTQLQAGLLSEGAESARHALRMCESSGLAHDAAFARLVLAAVHLRAGRLGAAEHEALTSARAMAAFGDEQFCARAALVVAQVATAAGDPRADSLLDEAIALLDAGGWSVPLAWALVQRAERPDAAGRAALARVEPLVAELGLPSLSHALDVRRAHALLAAGQVDDAIDLLRGTVVDIDTRGRDHVDPLLRVAAHSEATATHDLLVDTLVRRGLRDDAAEALRVSDAAKAQTLLDHAEPSRRPGGPPHRDPDDGDLERRALMADLSATYSALATAPRGRDELLREQARSIEARLATDRLSSSLRQTATTRAIGRRGSDDVQLAPALAFHVTGDDVLAFVIGDDGAVSSHRLSGATVRCERLLDQLAAQWARFELGAVFARRHGAVLERTARAVLADLYAELVAPVRPLLDRLAGRRLVVVPHRLLHRVPFAALHDGDGYLLETWTLESSPVLPRRGSRVETRVAIDNTMILAVPDERAPMIADEADRLGRLLPQAQLLVGTDAVVEALSDREPGPGVVHLACHGLHRPDNPAFSALRLGDRWLTCADLLDLDLSDTLLTLSACESGEAGQTTAEPVGLAWAALAAGSCGVVVSQWVLDDAVAVDLMARLYEGLASGRPASEALRDAQLAVSETHAHPYFWAPLMLVTPPSSDERKPS